VILEVPPPKFVRQIHLAQLSRPMAKNARSTLFGVNVYCVASEAKGIDPVGSLSPNVIRFPGISVDQIVRATAMKEVESPNIAAPLNPMTTTMRFPPIAISHGGPLNKYKECQHSCPRHQSGVTGRRPRPWNEIISRKRGRDLSVSLTPTRCT